MLHLPTAFLLVFLYLDPLHGAWDLSVRKNTLIVDVTSDDKQTVTIECNAQSGQSVHWKKGIQIRSDTATLTLRVKEEVSAGNFTCHENGQILDYKVVLVNEPNRPVHQKILTQAKDPIECSTKNYNGNFSCSWKTTDDNTEFIFRAHRNNNGSSSISCDEPIKDNGVYTVQCRDEQSCHYAEEDNSIIGELHAIRQQRYENYTLSFMLREVTKPDPPQDLNSKKNHHHVTMHWKYPKTWCHMHSFFPLLFNLKITDGQETTEMETKETHFHLYDKDIKSFCVQAKDMFFNSSWSEWSCYK